MRFKLQWKKVTAMLTTLVMPLGFLTCFPSGALTLEISAEETAATYNGTSTTPETNADGVY